MRPVLYVFFGGMVGTLLRILVTLLLPNSPFPYATLFANGTGSFLLGFLTGCCENKEWRLFFGTGVLGAYTTFSTFILEVLQLDPFANFLYLFLSILSGVMLAGIGQAWGKKVKHND